MTRSLGEFIPELRRLLGMYVYPRTFVAAFNFIQGYSSGGGDESLDGFHDWLLLRGNGRPELTWPWLVLCEIYPQDRLPDIRHFTDHQDEEAIGVLFDLLGKYLGLDRLGGSAQ